MLPSKIAVILNLKFNFRSLQCRDPSKSSQTMHRPVPTDGTRMGPRLLPISVAIFGEACGFEWKNSFVIDFSVENLQFPLENLCEIDLPLHACFVTLKSRTELTNNNKRKNGAFR